MNEVEITDLYQGQSKSISVLIRDDDENAYAHASILEVWAILTLIDSKGNEKTLMQWSKNAKDGYTTMVTEAAAGYYSLLIERSDSLNFPEQGRVFVEITAKLDSDVFADEYLFIDKTEIYAMKKAASKKIG